MEKGQIYKCNICGNVVELVEVGGGKLVCCGKEMVLQGVKNEDKTNED